MTMNERLARIRETRHRLPETGPVLTHGLEWAFSEITMPETDCDLLRDLFVAERVETVVEIGLAYASSALAIGEALVAVGRPRPRHIVIDPYQDSIWSNVGRDLLRTAGLEPIVEFVAEPSSVALPRLVRDGVVADAAFVDGGHGFHDVFVDLYFLRQIVRPGGVIVVDDDWAYAVRTAARYYERNLGWTFVPTFDKGTQTWVGDDPAAGIEPRCRALRLPDDPSVEPSYEDLRPFWPGG
jgi:predicted O-methyltransferase YrrM